MPNYVANVIDFSNTDKAVFDRICTFMDTEKELGKNGSKFDFNRLVPMPESLLQSDAWYAWRLSHWGTKWNAWEIDIDTVSQQIRFYTAWSFPEPIAYALIEKFPEADFVWTYADEDYGSNTGCFENTNGETYLNCYTDCSDEAYECYIAVWNQECCFTKDADGHWIHRDCDTCQQYCQKWNRQTGE